MRLIQLLLVVICSVVIQYGCIFHNIKRDKSNTENVKIELLEKVTTKKFLHTPVATRNCSGCHKSININPNLLIEKVNKLCYSCHKEIEKNLLKKSF